MSIEIRKKKKKRETSKQILFKIFNTNGWKSFCLEECFRKIFLPLKRCAIPPPPPHPAWIRKCNLMSSYRAPFRTFSTGFKTYPIFIISSKVREKVSSLYKIIQPRAGKILGEILETCNFSSLKNSGRTYFFLFFFFFFSHERMKFWYIPTLCWHFLLIFRDCIICNLPSPMEKFFASKGGSLFLIDFFISCEVVS